jgi:SAM-dependent methyltransferase
MRQVARLKLGYYPLPRAEGPRIGKMLSFGAEPTSVLDPCVGGGEALHVVTSGATACQYYGIELDADRADAAERSGIATIQGNTFDVHAKVEQFSLLYLNPPYDSEIGSFSNKRMEMRFLEHTYAWLKPGGVLVFVIPYGRLYPCVDILASHFADVKAYRLSDPESIRFNQAVVFAVRRVQRGRAQEQNVFRLRRLAGNPADLPLLSDNDGAIPYVVPPSPPATLVYRGLPLDELENLIPASNAWKQTAHFFLPKEEIHTGKPLTPLHGGHVGLLCTAGLLNGVFGEHEQHHIARWRSIKHVSVTNEEGEDEETIVRRRERFSNELALIYVSGDVQLLSETAGEEGKSDEERTPADGAAGV